MKFTFSTANLTLTLYALCSPKSTLPEPSLWRSSHQQPDQHGRLHPPEPRRHAGFPGLCQLCSRYVAQPCKYVPSPLLLQLQGTLI